MENKWSEFRFIKIATILLLVALFVATGLLISLEFKLNRALGADTQLGGVVQGDVTCGEPSLYASGKESGPSESGYAPDETEDETEDGTEDEMENEMDDEIGKDEQAPVYARSPQPSPQPSGGSETVRNFIS